MFSHTYTATTCHYRAGMYGYTVGDKEMRILLERAAYVRCTDLSQAAGGDIQEAAEYAREQSTDEDAREDHRVHVRGQMGRRQNALHC